MLQQAAGSIVHAAEAAQQPLKRAKQASRAPAPAQAASAAPAGPLPRLALLLLLLFALLLRYGVSGGGYSGAGGAQAGYPLGGDFEAQRHWMEVGAGLPPGEWYEGAHPANELQYWGLDYPPLTAFHAALAGRVAQWVGMGEMVALGRSRGIESEAVKLFMRLSALLTDLLSFMPAVVAALSAIYARDSKERRLTLAALALMQPAFILIDHGHFQYNCFCLGLVCLAIYFLWTDRHLLGSICFTLALTFKQMALYFAPAFFVYLLARSRMDKDGRTRVSVFTWFGRVALIGVVVLGTLALVFLPWLHSSSALLQVLHRMFPLARGIYEDKVANFWCATSLLYKWHLRLSRERMVPLSIAATLASFLPSCVHTYLRPSKWSFLYTLVSTAFSFFLFSFQVHEKTILFPLLPCALLAGRHPLISGWLGIIATFSMYPLLYKDGQALNYFALQLLFTVVVLDAMKKELFASCGKAPGPPRRADNVATAILQQLERYPLAMYRCIQLSLVGCVLLHVLVAVVPAPARYPDLHSLLFVVYSFAHFVLVHGAMQLAQWSLPAEGDGGGQADQAAEANTGSNSRAASGGREERTLTHHTHEAAATSSHHSSSSKKRSARQPSLRNKKGA